MNDEELAPRRGIFHFLTLRQASKRVTLRVKAIADLALPPKAVAAAKPAKATDAANAVGPSFNGRNVSLATKTLEQSGIAAASADQANGAASARAHSLQARFLLQK